MNDFLRSILEGINTIVQNHGWSIIVFTMLIRFVLMPLDIKSRKGMRQMSKMQPKINELTKKYGNDKQRLQQKQSELFKKEHYNPLSGCLPVLIQWPILIAMFAAMRAIANEQLIQQVFTYISGQTPVQDSWLWIKSVWMPDSPFASIAPDMNSLSIIGADVWAKVVNGFSPEYLAQIIANIPDYTEGMLAFTKDMDTKTLQATVQTLYNAMQAQPAFLTASAYVPGWKNVSLLLFSFTVYVQNNGLLILPVLAGVSQWLMTKLNPTETAPAAPQANGQPAPGQGMNSFMKYFFPLLSVYFCLTSNAGFAIYWVTSNLIAGAQSVLITRYYDRKDKLAAQAAGEGSVK